MVKGSSEFYAHSVRGRPEEAWEALRDHLLSVGDRAAGFAAPFGWAEAARAVGLLHDIGKCSAAFQAYIRGDRSSGADHSTAGARGDPARCAGAGRGYVLGRPPGAMFNVKHAHTALMPFVFPRPSSIRTRVEQAYSQGRNRRRTHANPRSSPSWRRLLTGFGSAEPSRPSRTPAGPVHADGPDRRRPDVRIALLRAGARPATRPAAGRCVSSQRRMADRTTPDPRRDR